MASSSSVVDKGAQVTEGSATVLFPSANEVFYNPVQQFNRDLSVMAIRAWSHTLAHERQQKHANSMQRQSKRRKLNEQKSEDCVSSTAPAVVGEDHSSAAEKLQKNDTVDSKEPETTQNETEPATISTPDISFTILEALSATGLRAIRYAKEIPNLASVTANDLSQTAVKQIKLNSEHNSTTDKVIPNQDDARVVMYTAKKRYHAIDLDPYGSAAPFIDGAVQAVEDGGLLLITCTDLAVLAGDAHPEKCWSQYGGSTIRQSEFCHEQALRMVLNTIANSAARYGRAITPLLSLSIDFYVRIFVRVDTSPARVKHLMSNTILTYQCSGCRSHTNQPMGNVKEGARPDLFKFSGASLTAGMTCDQCGFSQQIGGPMYGGPLHDHAFIDEILKMTDAEEASGETVFGTIPRIRGMLSVAREELTVPHHWSVAKLTKVVHCQSPPQDKILSAILNAGYEVSGSHTTPRSIKTNAPKSFMWDIMRAWIKLNPIKEDSIKPGSPGAAILARREPATAIDFTYHKGAKPSSKAQGLVRYQINPTENWGPKTMARGTTSNTSDQFREKEKRKRSGGD
ncbi:N2,N2-dimethylguanosine tRNA methyltransferase [Taphrina deformans PYCC 5710]|uniref:tRNA (guanine(26)-N(2))-dimethyltransferase n=1 Tax=Taphrina deformans (strain PYCC 5710 / ATCC 11124 / CBS 356.35 / IMI 108563 / JCM 9778 / NBRC 8474) TaxID=1097556 RepID=R4X6W2_TAPDE|nr:N2,N2-dimethylguanosine tRNA methyltransferase [Taphrina deformans PYCC 5710]|eukprot:CCG80706.1 N2,N2-dimethylguanosine tRNA methyltransferase [Taphrina deformans PYCC 5710]